MIFTKQLNIGTIVALCILSTIILALLVVGILKFIQVLKKQIKRNKRLKGKKIDSNESLMIFGGIENIEKIERQLNRILVKVKDKKLVQFNILKEMNIGTQITGNIIKCSSEKLADSLENVL